MTVTYTAEVASSSFACFLKLLIRWKGSVYKLVWKEFFIFVFTYYVFNLVYRFAMNAKQRRIFEMVQAYCEQYNNLIPVAFVLGFYVAVVVTRWWDQFNTIPWPDRMAMFVTANVQGQDDRARLMRRTIMRYLCLAFVITMSSISPVVKKRFPSFQHITEAGIMNTNEEKILESLQTPHNKYFVPIAWCTSLLTRARKEGRIRDDHAVKTLVDELNAFRGNLGTLFNYDWVSIPLVYTQVVTLAVYTFFLSCVMGRQFVDNGQSVDMYVPIFTFLQFFFYMGWLKVAESLVNPFGEDDDDFDINSVIDRNLQVSYLVVDEMHSEHPQLIKDQYWDEVQFDLPYTAAALANRDPNLFLGSAVNISVTPQDAEFVPLQSIREMDELETIKSTHPTDIPRTRFTHKPTFARSVSKSNKGFRNLLRRSTSRQSSKLSPAITKRNNYNRQGSENSSVGTALELGSVVTGKTDIYSQEDIFQMSDLESQVGEKRSIVDFQSQNSLYSDRGEPYLPSVQESPAQDNTARGSSAESAETVKSLAQADKTLTDIDYHTGLDMGDGTQSKAGPKDEKKQKSNKSHGAETRSKTHLKIAAKSSDSRHKSKTKSVSTSAKPNTDPQTSTSPQSKEKSGERNDTTNKVKDNTAATDVTARLLPDVKSSPEEESPNVSSLSPLLSKPKDP